MLLCKDCNSELVDTARICDYCGAPTPESDWDDFDFVFALKHAIVLLGIILILILGWDRVFRFIF